MNVPCSRFGSCVWDPALLAVIWGLTRLQLSSRKPCEAGPTRAMDRDLDASVARWRQRPDIGDQTIGATTFGDHGFVAPTEQGRSGEGRVLQARSQPGTLSRSIHRTASAQAPSARLVDVEFVQGEE